MGKSCFPPAAGPVLFSDLAKAGDAGFTILRWLDTRHFELMASYIKVEHTNRTKVFLC